MSRRLFMAGCLLLFTLSSIDGDAQGAKQKELKEFYIDIDAVSDAGPFWFNYVLHVEPVADGTRVRYIRVAPPDAQCQETVTVKAADALLKDTRVWEAPGDLNLCSFTESEVDAAIKPYRYRAASIWDTAAYGIVTKCGSSERLLKLPYSDEVDFDRLTKNEPRIKALYDLSGSVVRRAFEGKSPLHNLSAEQDRVVQEQGKLVLEELRSGKFDRGFWKPIGGDRSKEHFSMRAVLENYRGIYVSASREGRLVDAQGLQFIKYVPPPYPQIARMARIQGNVSLVVTASPKDGSVQEVKFVSGHPMLEKSAIEAARQWVFQPGQEKLNAPIAVTLEFSFQCPKL